MPDSTNLLGVIVLTHWDDTVVQVMPQTAGYLHRLTAAVRLSLCQSSPPNSAGDRSRIRRRR